MDKDNQKINNSDYEFVKLRKFKKKYIDSLDLTDKELEKNIKSQDLLHWKYSSVARNKSILNIAYNNNLDTTDSITAVYKLRKVQSKEDDIIFATAYIAIKSSKDLNYQKNVIPIKRPTKEVSLEKKAYINKVSCSGSMVSKDGEYRSSMLSWYTLKDILDTTPKMKKIYDFIIDYLNIAFLEREYSIFIDYFYPRDKIKNLYQFETELLGSSIKLELFSITWFSFMYAYYFGFLSNNLNNDFITMLLQYKKEDVAFFKRVMQVFSPTDLDEYRYIINNDLFSTKYNLYEKTKMGQKIIPLNLIEAQNFFNIEYHPWKELAINIKISDLVLNNVTNGFPISYNWLLIKANENLFDSRSQYQRMHRSKAALRIAEILSQAKLYTYYNINEIDKLKAEEIFEEIPDKELLTPWLSNEFQILYDKIQNSIDHAKENIIVSNVVISFISEYVGKTFYDSLIISENSIYYKSLSGNMFDKDNFGIFTKYMFQICYNLYCLNSKLYTIHGDLHLNNITLNTILYKKNAKIDIKNPKLLYILDNNNQYIFDQNFYDICLIDFSRAIIHPDHYELFKNSYIPDYEIVHSQQQFSKRQIDMLLLFLYYIKPEFKECDNIIRNDISFNYDKYFKILTALDLLNVSSKILSFITSKKSSIKACKESIILLKKLVDSSSNIITSKLNKIINERNSGEEINDFEWPILTIIKEVFEDSHINKFKSTEYSSIIDIYNFNNTVENTLQVYKKFPEEIKSNKIQNVIIPGITKDLYEKRKLYEAKTEKNFRTVDVIIKRQREKYL